MSWLDKAILPGTQLIKKASAGQVEQYLRQMSAMLTQKPKGFAYASAYAYYLDHGVDYQSAPMTPDELARIKHALANAQGYKAKECFYNSQILATGNPRLRYVEGYVITDRIPFPLEHGWNTLNGKVIDFTLKHANGGKPIVGEIPAGWEYFGVEFPTTMVHALHAKHGLAMPLVTNYHDGFPLLQEQKPKASRKRTKAEPQADQQGTEQPSGDGGEHP